MNYIIGLGFGGFFMHLKISEVKQRYLSLFLDNIEHRERIRPKLLQYNTFTVDTPLPTRQKLLDEILDGYEKIDPYPLPKSSLGALHLLQQKDFVKSDPRLYMNSILTEFNVEYWQLKPYHMSYSSYFEHPKNNYTKTKGP